MSGARWQTRATDAQDICVEMVAFYFLSGIIGWSVTKTCEYGGVIFLDSATGLVGATGPVMGEAITVDVGQNKIKMGLPATLKPLAWYHTHPLKEKPQDDGTILHFEWDKFIGGDKGISDDKRLVGFVGTMDGGFWRYDPAPEALDGNYGPGLWERLNPRLTVDRKSQLVPNDNRWSPRAPTLKPIPAFGLSRTPPPSR